MLLDNPDAFVLLTTVISAYKNGYLLHSAIGRDDEDRDRFEDSEWKKAKFLASYNDYV